MKTNKENPPQNEWGPFPFGDGRRILDIRYDAVFKGVFTKDTAKSRGALSDLISALIGRAVTVETVIANEPAADDLRQRYTADGILAICINNFFAATLGLAVPEKVTKWSRRVKRRLRTKNDILPRTIKATVYSTVARL